jgi:hypothetical protein
VAASLGFSNRSNFLTIRGVIERFSSIFDTDGSGVVDGANIVKIPHANLACQRLLCGPDSSRVMAVSNSLLR